MTEEALIAWAGGFVAGYDQGYYLRVREENADWPPPPVYAFGRWYDQALEREKADRR